MRRAWESSTRLYYHVGELERVGLVRLVRTETKSGTVHKYYRSVSRFLNVPTSLLHVTGSPEQEAAVDWFCSMLENSVMDVRQAFAAGPDFDRDLTFVTRNYIRTTPERAREFVRRMEELQEEFLMADDEDATFRIRHRLAGPNPALPDDFTPASCRTDAGRETRRCSRFASEEPAAHPNWLANEAELAPDASPCPSRVTCPELRLHHGSAVAIWSAARSAAS